MDVYVEAAQRVLTDITQGKVDYESRLVELQAEIKDKLARAGRLVVCGMSPVGKIAKQNLLTYEKPVNVLDLRDPSRNNERLIQTDVHGGETLYVICSREDAVKYLEIAPETNTDVLSFNELFLLDSSFDYCGTAFHNHEYCCRRLQDVFRHAELYLEMLDDMADAHSRQILARIILYRYTWDLFLCLDIKSSESPYFKKFMELSEQEVFVDAGGFDGDTLRDFLHATNGNFVSYHYFEPEEQAFHKAKSSYGNDARILFHQEALSSDIGTKRFEIFNGGDQGRISKSGKQTIRTVTLDSLHIAPTFIKMDIEGAECEALRRAENTIKSYHPKLAICIYHKPNDLANVYRLLRQYGYDRFYLRAEADSLDYEMVMYARAKGERQNEKARI